MSRHPFVIAALWVSACAPPVSSTEVQGSVGSFSFPTAYAIYGKDPSQNAFDSGKVFVLISQSSLACSHLVPTGLLTRSGVSSTGSGGSADERIPSLYFIVGDPAATWSTHRTIGNGMVANLDPGGAAVAPLGPPATLDAATVGGLILDRFDDTSVSGALASGTFDLGFAGGSFSGTFVATPCGALRSGCSSSGAELALPALLAAIGALRRRRG